MHKRALTALVISVRKRIAQGDCPTEPPVSQALLEEAVNDLGTPDGKTYEIDAELMHRIYNTLVHYANEHAYEAKRTGGVAQGCPRGPVPTPRELVWPARFLLREIEHDVLKRIEWDWIGKYEPTGPHCDTCRCSAHPTNAEPK